MSDLIFMAGGECLERYGTLVRHTTASEDAAVETHTRSGTVGKFVSPSGVLLDADANRPRVDWLDNAPYLLLEAARTNLVDDDNISTGWTHVLTPTVTATDDPAGGSTAYTIEDNNAGQQQSVRKAVTFTGDAEKSVVFVIRENTAPTGSEYSQLIVWDLTASTSRAWYQITAWTDGEPTVTAHPANTGSYLGKRYVGNGYWAVYIRTSSVTAANSNAVWVTVDSGGTGTGSIDVYRVNAYNNPIPSFSILDASETRNRDTFYAPFPHRPQEMTVYAKWMEVGSAFVPGAFPFIVEVGSSTATGCVQIRRDNSNGDGRYECVVQIAGTQTSLSEPNATVEWGDTVEFVAQVAATGAIKGILSINGGTEVTTAAGVAAGLPSTWTNSRIELGEGGVSSIRSVKVARGTKTLAEMRAL